ncbi:PREDICTED: uncharacterized protein LOC109168983 [Ipomoea nil]|uniref:uncharacterized protein LOC109168983 n=1 Tax=Ipomoea nil TaxID=35883 RepID=UPI000901CE43|nr:PREDICTED: uncharacterized protein LOC109168983 [Ipomoea nil]
MEDLRSKSYNDSRMQVVDTYNGFSNPNPGGPQDLRCYSASYAYSNNNTQAKTGGRDANLKKGWVLGDPELQRKKRVASYKAYAVEGKLKGSIKKSFRWIKERYTQVVYGRR